MSLRRTVFRPLTIGKTVVSALRGDGRGWILATIAFGWFLSLGIRLTVPAIIPYVQAAFQVDLGTTGILLSLLWITYALFQFPGGIIGDRLGERNVLTWSTCLVLIALLVSGVADGILFLAIGIGFIGAATGTYAAPRFTALSDIYPNHSATAMGISSACGNVGTVILPVVAGVLAVSIHWKASFVGFTPLFLLAALGLWLTVPERTSQSSRSGGDLLMETLRHFVRGIQNQRTALLAVLMFLFAFIYQGFTSFYPSYLATAKTLPEDTAAVLYSVFFAAGIVVQPLSGASADIFGERWTVTVIGLLTATALILITVVDGFWALFFVSFLMGAKLGFWPIAQSAVIDSLPSGIQGSGFGLISTLYLLLAAVSPAIIGVLAVRQYFNEAFFLLAGCAIIAVLLTVTVLPPAE